MINAEINTVEDFVDMLGIMQDKIIKKSKGGDALWNEYASKVFGCVTRCRQDLMLIMDEYPDCEKIS